MSIKESDTNATAAGAIGLYITVPRRLVFDYNKVENWKLIRKLWTKYTLLSELWEKQRK